jgi:hypothetical protein
VLTVTTTLKTAANPALPYGGRLVVPDATHSFQLLGIAEHVTDRGWTFKQSNRTDQNICKLQYDARAIVGLPIPSITATDNSLNTRSKFNQAVTTILQIPLFDFFVFGIVNDRRVSSSTILSSAFDSALRFFLLSFVVVCLLFPCDAIFLY